MANGYVFVKCDGHPRADVNGYVREHILVAERAFGGALPKGAIVHHINEDRADNRSQNLLVCTEPYHFLLHARMRAQQQCGNPNWLHCCYCKKYDDPVNLHVQPMRGSKVSPRAYHRKCANAYNRQHKGKQRIARPDPLAEKVGP